MKKEDLSIIKSIKKQMRKNPLFRYVIASKKGGNSKGKGKDRSVILATNDGKTWFQYHKIWGKSNELRARYIINSLRT